MIRIEWRSEWAGRFGGVGSPYYQCIWEKSNERPYLDASYWVWWEQWFEKEVNGKFVRSEITAPWGGRKLHPISHIEFENESDAAMFMLRCP